MRGTERESGRKSDVVSDIEGERASEMLRELEVE